MPFTNPNGSGQGKGSGGGSDVSEEETKGPASYDTGQINQNQSLERGPTGMFVMADADVPDYTCD
jgi:hypothetical protein